MISFMKRIKLPNDCIENVVSLYEKIKEDTAIKDIVLKLENRQYDYVDSIIKEFSSDKGLDNKLVNLAIICATHYIFKQRFSEKNVPEDIFWASMSDIRYKLMECKNTYGIWGISFIPWYYGYYEAARYDLGRLQFEEKYLEQERYSHGETIVLKGNSIVNTHIPSSGSLLKEDVIDSLKRAYDFMEFKYDGKMFIACKSWLLYPSYKHLFGEKSNIRQFIDLFDVYDVVDDEDFAFGCEHVFCREATCEIHQLPQDTSLQRAFVNYMKQDNPKFGRGYGMMVMKDGKIIH